jgi:hypothetical protein
MPQLRDIPNLAGMEEEYNFLIIGLFFLPYVLVFD